MTAGNRAASSAGGSIYDLGYRHYEGKRNGRRYAVWSLYVESFRSVWGFGRPVRSKAAPLIIAGLFAFPAIVQLALSSVLLQQIQNGEQVTLFKYSDYFERFGFFMILFCVAQAPELVCRDQRYQVLPLYFTRALGRVDYAVARFAALATALFVALLVPMIALFVGDVLMKPDTLAAIGTEWPKALPSIPACALIGLGMGAISLSLSAFSPRRAYSAIGLVAYFLIMEAVPTAIFAIGHSGSADWTWSDKLVLLTPITSLSSAVRWFFGARVDTGLPTTLGSFDYVLAAIVSTVLFTGILIFRYRRISA